MDVAWTAHKELTAMQTLFIWSLNGELTREHGLDGTPSEASTSSVPSQSYLYPSGQCTLTFCTKCVMPVGHIVVAVETEEVYLSGRR